MKRILSMLLIAALCICCAAASAETPAFTAGTYPVTVNGRNGEMTIEVTFTDSAIEHVAVTAHQETAGISDAAIEQIPEAIVNNQSLAVDAIAGATITSDAIIEAVALAVEQAGGDVGALQTAAERQTSTETVTMAADVVVVGAGGGGLTAAVSLAQQGISVALLEKMSFPGGATVTCGGGLTVAATAELKELGEHDDPSVLEAYVAEHGNNLNIPELTHIFAYESGPAVDYLRGLGVEITYSSEPSPRSNPSYALYSMNNGGAGFIATISEIAKQTENLQYMLSTDVKELLTDESGAVTGVRALAADGTTYVISAKAVVLATGSYSGNDDIVSTYYLPDTINTAPVYLTADGILMAQEVGAAVNHLEWVEVSPAGIATSEHAGTYTSSQASITSTTGSIIVNQSGVRVMNEEASSAEQIEVYKAQENHAVYLVMNQNGYDQLKGAGINFGHVFFTAEDVDGWLAQDSIYPIMVKGDTAAEAAEAAGIDGAALTETIARYNEIVAAGEDTDFGHTVSEPIEGPIYILELRLRHSKALGGLIADENLQILDTDGNPIPNLYGVGELVSGSQGDTETGMLTWVIASAYHVGQTLGETLR